MSSTIGPLDADTLRSGLPEVCVVTGQPAAPRPVRLPVLRRGGGLAAAVLGPWWVAAERAAAPSIEVQLPLAHGVIERAERTAQARNRSLASTILLAVASALTGRLVEPNVGALLGLLGLLAFVVTLVLAALTAQRWVILSERHGQYWLSGCSRPFRMALEGTPTPRNG